jgi:predicted DNA-binding ribbon-helix-helix protein
MRDVPPEPDILGFQKERNMSDLEEKSIITVDLTDEQFLILAKMAHEQDITFNQLVCNILREQIEKETVQLSEESLSTEVSDDRC